METSLHDYVVQELLDARGRWPTVARESGVSRRTIEKIAHRDIVDPSVSHIEKLARYFRNASAARA